MKLLKYVSSRTEAELMVEQLKVNGILAISNDAASNNIIPLFNANAAKFEVGIWLIMDYQYNDAVALLDNPEHTVEFPLTPREMELVEEERKKAYSPYTKKILYFVMKIFILGVTLTIISYFIRTVVLLNKN
jgi:hypothetical protein